jgi:nucleoside-diphosphate-sugar epimerase
MGFGSYCMAVTACAVGFAPGLGAAYTFGFRFPLCFQPALTINLDKATMDKPRRALLTGGTGFIGLALARRLSADGLIVTAAVRSTSDPGRVALLREVAQVQTLDPHSGPLPILCEAKPDVVFHLASKFVAEHRPDQVDAILRDNIVFGVRLLEAMKQSGARRLVSASTTWQRFDSEAYSPANFYAASKQAFEDFTQYYVEAAGFGVIHLVLSDTYGPEDRRQKLFSVFAVALGANRPVAMSGGEQFLDLVHVADAAAAFAAAGERVASCPLPSVERFAISSGRPIRLRELAGQYELAAGQALNIAWGERPYRAREIFKPTIHFAPVPGWKPTVDLTTGLRELLQGNAAPSRQAPGAVALCSGSTTEPYWSVMIPTRNRFDYLQRTLRAVLDQDPGAARMQIQVVDNSTGDHSAESIIQSLGGGRVEYFRQPSDVGMAQNWNSCIARARGQWVHVLHDDDYVADGFYRSLESALAQYPSARLAFVRTGIVDFAENLICVTGMARPSNGIVADWPLQVIQRNELRCPAVVVRRDAYAEVGGFSHEFVFCPDLEMWCRLAARYPVLHLPEILAFYRVHGAAETARLKLRGEVFNDLHRALGRMRKLIPPDRQSAIDQFAIANAGETLSAARDAFAAGHSLVGWRQLWFGVRFCPWSPPILARAGYLAIKGAVMQAQKTARGD